MRLVLQERQVAVSFLPSIFSALTVLILRWRSHSPRSRSQGGLLRSGTSLDGAVDTRSGSALEDL
eukprot:13182870-Heterocapsa_arctica.AAC.1